MTIVLSHKEIEENGRLVKCLASGLVPVNELRNHLEKIQQKAEPVDTAKRNTFKADRKDSYKRKLRVV